MDRPERPASPWAGRFLLGLTLLAAGLRFYHAGTQSLWIDEIATIKYTAPFGQYSWTLFFYNLHGALYSALLHAWSHVFGTSEFGLRSLSAFLGTVTVPLFYWALLPLRRRATALVATALLAVHPFHVWYSQELRGYVLLLLCVVVSTGCFLRAVDGGRRSLPLYAAANLAGLLSNLAHAFTLVAHGWTQILRGRRGRTLWRGLVLSWLVSFVLLGPWIYVFWENQIQPSRVLGTESIPTEERIRGESTAPILGIPFTYYTFSVGYSYGPSLRELAALNQGMDLSLLRPHVPGIAWAAIAFGIAAVIGFVRLWRSGVQGRTWVWLAVIPVLLVYGTAVRNLKVFNPRYAAAAFPAYLLGVSEGIVAVGRRRSLLLGLAVFLPTGVSLAQHYTDSDYGKDQTREAVAYLKSEMRPGDLFCYIGVETPLHYYYWRDIRNEPNGIEHIGTHFFTPSDWPGRFARMDSLLAGHDRVFLLFMREAWDDPEGRFRAHVDEAYDVEEKAVFRGTEVWKIAVPSHEEVAP
ncbi:MAG: glycosyltransferase family 39 protein [Candidatus Eisenbacteria bacterium]